MSKINELYELLQSREFQQLGEKQIEEVNKDIQNEDFETALEKTKE